MQHKGHFVNADHELYMKTQFLLSFIYYEYKRVKYSLGNSELYVIESEGTNYTLQKHSIK